MARRDLLIYRGKKKLDLYDLQPRSLRIEILSATDSSNPSDHINTVFSSTIGGARRIFFTNGTGGGGGIREL